MSVALNSVQRLTAIFTELKTEFATEEEQIQVAIKTIQELPSPRDEPKDPIKIGVARHQLHQQFPNHKKLKELGKEVYDFLRFINERIDEREQQLSNGAFTLQTAEGNTGIGDLLTFGNYYLKRELEKAELAATIAPEIKVDPEAKQQASVEVDAVSAGDIAEDYDELDEWQSPEGNASIQPDYRLRLSVEMFDTFTAPELLEQAKENAKHKKADEVAAVKDVVKPKSPGIKQTVRKAQG